MPDFKDLSQSTLATSTLQRLKPQSLKVRLLSNLKINSNKIYKEIIIYALFSFK